LRFEDKNLDISLDTTDGSHFTAHGERVTGN